MYLQNVHSSNIARTIIGVIFLYSLKPQHNHRATQLAYTSMYYVCCLCNTNIIKQTVIRYTQHATGRHLSKPKQIKNETKQKWNETNPGRRQTSDFRSLRSAAENVFCSLIGQSVVTLPRSDLSLAHPSSRDQVTRGHVSEVMFQRSRAGIRGELMTADDSHVCVLFCRWP